jgi:hypothetical protein
LRHPPFPPAAAPEIIGIAVCFHYVNRMVAIFLAPSPLPFASPRLKAMTRRMLGPILTGLLQRRLVAGESLQWLPDAPLPPDLAWAAGHPIIAAAFARAAASFTAAGESVVPAAVRALLNDRLQCWHGEAMGLGRGWVEDAVTSLDAELRPAARLALLTAFAPFQVDDAVLEEFRRTRPSDAHDSDAALVAATAWASFAAARRIGTWLAPGLAPPGPSSPARPEVSRADSRAGGVHVPPAPADRTPRPDSGGSRVAHPKANVARS